jgi:predicted TPR repeat methyltransferase
LALGELAHIIGRRDSARDAYQAYLKLCPDNAEAKHILAALLDLPAPQRAPDECIKQLYSRFATFYEDHMCGDLDYQAPLRMQEMLHEHLGEVNELDVLELGCGTGLTGKLLRPLARRLTGVDLSPEMIEKSQASELNDSLQLAEITAYLAADNSTYKLIVACDTLIYFGDLNQVLGPASQRLLPDGWIGFTVEKGTDSPYRLTDTPTHRHTDSPTQDVSHTPRNISGLRLRMQVLKL